MKEGNEDMGFHITEAQESVPFEEYRSVEFSLDGLELPHQFRIWNTEPNCMFVLMKQNSKILKCIRAGETMKMKYYTNDTFRPTRTIDTQISHITREDEGRFKGHCVVGLAPAP